jgi:hypothetical protein
MADDVITETSLDDIDALTRAAIAHDPRKPVDLEIPLDADRELLALIASTAADQARILVQRAGLAVREDEEVELRILSSEAQQRQKEAEARLKALGRESDNSGPWDRPEIAAIGETAADTSTKPFAEQDLYSDPGQRCIGQSHLTPIARFRRNARGEKGPAR